MEILGIFRDVYLQGLPKSHVYDIDLKSDYDYKNHTGDLNTKITMTGAIGNKYKKSKWRSKNFI